MSDLIRCTALITGANRGIGAEVASALPAAGATVAIKFPDDGAVAPGATTRPMPADIPEDVFEESAKAFQTVGLPK